MLTISTDMMQTVAIAIIVLFIGKYLRRKVSFFERFCIPAPVIGGFLFAIIHLILKSNNIATFEMDQTLKNPFMMVFFTSIGVGANLETLKKGGKGFIIFTILSAVLVFLQNAVGMGLAKVLGQNSFLGLICGSATMIGGHGSAGAWGPTLENMGFEGATTIGLAAATFGVLMGSLIGGPIGSFLIKKNNLKPNPKDFVVDEVELDENNEPVKVHLLNANDFLKVLCLIFVSVGLGVILQRAIAENISLFGTPLNLPAYVTSMIFAGIYVNTLGRNEKFKVNARANAICGDVGLNVFLVMALIGLDLLQLKAVAGPMLIILFAQTALMAIFAIFACFFVMGRDYDAAVLSGGICGFGMGATYNAVANMDSITEKYGPSPKAYFIIPMVGAFAIDIINSLFITVFSNIRF